MGNHPLKDRREPVELQNYTPGSIEEFQNIIDHADKNLLSDPEFQAWKIACLYQFLIILDESEHDLGHMQPKLIEKFMELKSEINKYDDLSQRKKQGVYRATGNDNYKVINTEI